MIDTEINQAEIAIKNYFMAKNSLLASLLMYSCSIMCGDNQAIAPAAVEASDANGDTELHMLASAPHPKSDSKFTQMPDFERAQHALRLIENNADVYTPNNNRYKNTPLDYAFYFQQQAPNVYKVIRACAELRKLTVQQEKLAKRGQQPTQTARDKWTAQEKILKPYRPQTGASDN